VNHGKNHTARTIKHRENREGKRGVKRRWDWGKEEKRPAAPRAKTLRLPGIKKLSQSTGAGRGVFEGAPITEANLRQKIRRKNRWWGGLRARDDHRRHGKNSRVRGLGEKQQK